MLAYKKIRGNLFDKFGLLKCQKETNSSLIVTDITQACHIKNPDWSAVRPIGNTYRFALQCNYISKKFSEH